MTNIDIDHMDLCDHFCHVCDHQHDIVQDKILSKHHVWCDVCQKIHPACTNCWKERRHHETSEKCTHNTQMTQCTVCNEFMCCKVKVYHGEYEWITCKECYDDFTSMPDPCEFEEKGFISSF